MLANAVVPTSPRDAEDPPLPRSLPRPAGLIFDLDGTLVDTVSARIAGWAEALGEAGVPSTAEQIAPMIGMDGRRLAKVVAQAAGRTLGDHEIEAVDKAAGEAFDQLNRDPRPLEGVGELLSVLDAAGIPWVIATSSRKEQVTRSVAALGLARPPKIVDGGHVKHAKPAPDLLLLAAKELALGPAACWAVGDSTWDMRAAVAGGITGVGVTAGSAVSAQVLVEAGAALVVATCRDLIAELRLA
ncbi:MAG TPA: HAD family phosphatase [Candidatus Dormibacteraeota bacterium]|nr:HAD family phosphatase [Candidatus Dormibacteraeota bacterium]